MEEIKEAIVLIVRAKFEKGEIVKTKGHNMFYSVSHRGVDLDTKEVIYSCFNGRIHEVFFESALVAAEEKVNAIGETYFE
ncbi:hypothetical protein MASR1M107_05240 [Ignavibacteriales bacterium]